MNKNKLIGLIVDIISIIVLVLLDQYTKILAVNSLKGNAPHVLIDGVLEFRYLENRGAAFGMLQDKKTLFVLCKVSCAFPLLFIFFIVSLLDHSILI